MNHKDSCGMQDFHDLGIFVLALLSLPASNAAVERAFSYINLIKNKIRNRLYNRKGWNISSV